MVLNSASAGTYELPTSFTSSDTFRIISGGNYSITGVAGRTVTRAASNKITIGYLLKDFVIAEILCIGY